MTKRVLFITDRVTHYNKELFQTLEARLSDRGMELFLLSGMTPSGERGRTGMAQNVITNEQKFKLREWKIGSYTFRTQDEIVDQVRCIRPDIVIMASHVGNIASWRLMRKKKSMGYRLVAWQCGYEFNPSRFKDFILSRFIPGFDHQLCYHTNAKLYALRYGASDDQVTVIHNTINDAKIRVIPKAEARKEIFSLFPQIGEKKILLFVGAILEEKRLDMVLDALDLLRREDLVFLVVGDGPYMEKVRRMSQNRTDVVLAGAVVDGVGTYFDAADIFVLPGTGGLAINEAMAHALPIVSGYADGSADDLVIDGVNGYRLRSSSPGELADRICNLLSQPAKMTMMGQASRQMITEKFSYQKFIDTVCQALENI